MTFRDDLRDICYNARSIPGELGMRPYTVEAVAVAWSGDEAGEGTETSTSVAIVEANGQNPKVRQLNSEELAVGGYAKGVWKIGPITPDFPGGGTLHAQLQQDPSENTLVHFVLTGPAYPDGQRFILVDVTDHRAFQYVINVQDAAAS